MPQRLKNGYNQYKLLGMSESLDLKNNRQLQIALAATIFLLLVIGGIFLRNTAYYEANQFYYIGAFIAGLGLFFWGLLSFRIAVLVPAVLIILISVMASIMKFDWRKGYIERAEAGNPFLFEEYIDTYPSLEEYLYANFFDGPNWIGFSQTCGEPAYKDQPLPALCSDLNKIKAEFGLNMKKIVNDHYKKMKKTATRIHKGQLTNKKRYEQCIKSKQCVIVPLLPAGVDPEQITGNDYTQVRQAFWSLVEDDKMNEIVCNQMMLCSLLVKMKALNASNF